LNSGNVKLNCTPANSEETTGRDRTYPAGKRFSGRNPKAPEATEGEDRGQYVEGEYGPAGLIPDTAAEESEAEDCPVPANRRQSSLTGHGLRTRLFTGLSRSVMHPLGGLLIPREREADHRQLIGSRDATALV
jgi:hypothetical protein